MSQSDRDLLRAAAYRLMLSRYDSGKPMHEVKAARHEWESLGGGYAYPSLPPPREPESRS